MKSWSCLLLRSFVMNFKEMLKFKIWHVLLFLLAPYLDELMKQQTYWGQLLERINESPWYAIQVNESTDVDHEATSLVFVQCVFQEDVHEDVLYALFLPTNTTAAKLFKSLNDHISGNLNWSFCVGTCMDGVAAMTGWYSGFHYTGQSGHLWMWVYTLSFMDKCWPA